MDLELRRKIKDLMVEKLSLKREKIQSYSAWKSSRNLYFVADWKDELCDLTIQDIIDKLGHDLEIK